ncbi:hypothetical protein O3P69_013652 [Scylla paramamosain]|uniref:Uncharacterized protein n=1 Tax=Scylla paramamosain TaxID=85552 RepID=A0AAW0SQB1_SCYPA
MNDEGISEMWVRPAARVVVFHVYKNKADQRENQQPRPSLPPRQMRLTTCSATPARGLSLGAHTAAGGDTGGGCTQMQFTIHHVAHHTWSAPGKHFNLQYQLVPATVCGPADRTEGACFTTPHLKEGLIASWIPSPSWTTCGSSQTGGFAVGEEPDAPLRGEELRPPSSVTSRTARSAPPRRCATCGTRAASGT